MTAYTAIFCSLIVNNTCLFFIIWVFLNSESLYIIGYRIFGCDRKENKDICDTTVTLTTRYPFFISLCKTLHRKRMDAEHCGVLVKTYNIFKMQKLMFIKTQSIF
jgi:hypothetical protein